jgi:hypothetical protein
VLEYQGLRLLVVVPDGETYCEVTLLPAAISKKQGKHQRLLRSQSTMSVATDTTKDEKILFSEESAMPQLHRGIIKYENMGGVVLCPPCAREVTHLYDEYSLRDSSLSFRMTGWWGLFSEESIMSICN